MHIDCKFASVCTGLLSPCCVVNLYLVCDPHKKTTNKWQADQIGKLIANTWGFKLKFVSPFQRGIQLCRVPAICLFNLLLALGDNSFGFISLTTSVHEIARFALIAERHIVLLHPDTLQKIQT